MPVVLVRPGSRLSDRLSFAVDRARSGDSDGGQSRIPSVTLIIACYFGGSIAATTAPGIAIEGLSGRPSSMRA